MTFIGEAVALNAFFFTNAEQTFLADKQRATTKRVNRQWLMAEGKAKCASWKLSLKRYGDTKVKRNEKQ